MGPLILRSIVILTFTFLLGVTLSFFETITFWSLTKRLLGGGSFLSPLPPITVKR